MAACPPAKLAQQPRDPEVDRGVVAKKLGAHDGQSGATGTSFAADSEEQLRRQTLTVCAENVLVAKAQGLQVFYQGVKVTRVEFPNRGDQLGVLVIEDGDQMSDPQYLDGATLSDQ